MFNKSIIILALTFIFVSKYSYANKGDLVLGNGEWPPYLSEKLTGNGFGSIIVTEVFRLVGVNVKYKFYPWNRAYYLAKNKFIDGTLLWQKTTERSKHFIYSEPIIIEDHSFFYLTGSNFDWKTDSDLTDIEIGTSIHTKWIRLEKLEKRGVIKLKRAAYYKKIFTRLVRGRFKVAACHKNVGLYYIKVLGLKDKIKVHKKPFGNKPYYLILNKSDRNQRIIKLFNKGLKEFKKTKKYSSIVKNFKEGKY